MYMYVFSFKETMVYYDHVLIESFFNSLFGFSFSEPKV